MMTGLMHDDESEMTGLTRDEEIRMAALEAASRIIGGTLKGVEPIATSGSDRVRLTTAVGNMTMLLVGRFEQYLRTGRTGE